MSNKNPLRDFKYVFGYEADHIVLDEASKIPGHVFELLPPVKPPPDPPKPWLSMTDEEIDQTYYHLGKADRTRMKKEAARERLRLECRAILEQEESNAKPNPPLD